MRVPDTQMIKSGHPKNLELAENVRNELAPFP